MARQQRLVGQSIHMVSTSDLTDLFLPEPEPRAVQVHRDLGGRPRGRARPHVRGPGARRAGGPSAPHRRDPEGHQVWEFEGERYTQVGMNAVAGRRPDTYGLEPFRFDQMRPGCYDVEARVRDMDINGVWASVNFPSQITGFCGRVFFDAPDRDAGPRLHPSLERLALRGVVLAAPGSDRAARHHVPGRSGTGRGRRSGATPSVASPRSPFPSVRTRSACRRSGTATTGIRSSRRWSRPTLSSPSTSAAPA